MANIEGIILQEKFDTSKYGITPDTKKLVIKKMKENGIKPLPTNKEINNTEIQNISKTENNNVDRIIKSILERRKYEEEEKIRKLKKGYHIKEYYSENLLLNEYLRKFGTSIDEIKDIIWKIFCKKFNTNSPSGEDYIKKDEMLKELKKYFLKKETKNELLIEKYKLILSKLKKVGLVIYNDSDVNKISYNMKITDNSIKLFDNNGNIVLGYKFEGNPEKILDKIISIGINYKTTVLTEPPVYVFKLKNGEKIEIKEISKLFIQKPFLDLKKQHPTNPVNYLNFTPEELMRKKTKNPKVDYLNFTPEELMRKKTKNPKVDYL